MISADEEDDDLGYLDFDLDELDEYNNSSHGNRNHSNNQAVHEIVVDELPATLENAYLEQIKTNGINKINKMNENIKKLMKTSNLDLQKIYKNIINENNKKIKQITDIYDDINISDKYKIYFIEHINIGNKVLSARPIDINDNANKKRPKNEGGKKSKKIMKSKKSKKSKSKKYIKSK